MPRELERLLLHPVVLVSLGLWALNDHYLKGALHNTFTGKLSDVTSLIAAPVLLAAASAALGLGRAHSRLLLTVWALVLMLVMVAIKLNGSAADVYRYGLAVLQWPFRSAWALELRSLAPVFLAMDASDVWTVPAALVAPLLLANQSRVVTNPELDVSTSGVVQVGIADRAR